MHALPVSLHPFSYHAPTHISSPIHKHICAYTHKCAQPFETALYNPGASLPGQQART